MSEEEENPEDTFVPDNGWRSLASHFMRQPKPDPRRKRREEAPPTPVESTPVNLPVVAAEEISGGRRK